MCDTEGGEILNGRESCAGDWTSKQLFSMSWFWSSAVFQSILRIENGEDLHLTHMTTEELNLYVATLLDLSWNTFHWFGNSSYLQFLTY